MAEVVRAEAGESSAGTLQVAAASPAPVAGAVPSGAAVMHTTGVDTSQAGVYAQAAAAYYPTISYPTTGQPFGTAAQILNSYQYVMPQAAYPQPTYGWAYYPAGAAAGATAGADPAAAQQGAVAVGSIALAPAAKETAAQLTERENKALRRKQANRESARRSKIRKKAESETLEKRAEEMDQESQTLAAEVQRVSSILAELKAKNVILRQQARTKGVPLEEFPPVEADPNESAPVQDGESPASTTPTTCGAQIAGDTAACGTSSLKEAPVSDTAAAELIGV